MISENKTIKDLVEILNSAVSGFLIGYHVLGPLILKIIPKEEEEEEDENYFEYEGEKGTVRIKWQA